MNLIAGVDLQQVWELDKHNREYATEALSLNGLWKHYESLNLLYGDLYHGVERSISNDKDIHARFCHFSGCFVNLAKGMSILLAGHLTDSSLYARRTLECVRISIFLREHPEISSLWFETSEKFKQQTFERKFQSWFNKGGKEMCETEFPNMNFGYKLASNFGAHANLNLFTYQQSVSRNDSEVTFRFNLHEIDPSERGFYTPLNHFLWFLSVHFQAAQWWIHKGRIHQPLTDAQLSFWKKQIQNYADDAERTNMMIQKHLATEKS